MAYDGAMTGRLGWVVVMVLAGMSSAAAQTAPMQPPPDMAPEGGSPGYFLMDNVHGFSMASADVGFTSFEGDATGLRLDLHGQVVTPAGFGGYGTVPLLFASVDTGGESETDTGIGNFELGGLYVLRQPMVDIILRGGVALPSARGSLDPTGDLAYFANVFTDLTDMVLVIPETTTLRFSASADGGTGQFYYRGDIGVDIVVDSPGDNPDPFYHINFAAGLNLGSAAAGIEFVTVDSTESGSDSISALALGGRYLAGTVRPAFAIGFPIDDDIGNLVDMYLFAGVDIAMTAFGM